MLKAYFGATFVLPYFYSKNPEIIFLASLSRETFLLSHEA
jgi:hypothetical protein